MTGVAELPDSAAETKRLRACLRDLVALSTTPVLWIGLPPAAIAESLRDLLMSMLRADVAYVRIRDADSGACLVAAAGADPAQVEAALERTAGSGELPTLPGEGGAAMRLASLPVGLDGERGWIAVGVERSGFPDEIESLLLQVGASQVAVALEHAVLLERHERAERLMAAQAAEQAAVARLGLRALTGLAPARLLQEVVEAVCDVLRVDFCTVLEVADGGDSLLLKAGAGWEPGVVGHARVSAGPGSLAGYTLLVSQPVVVADLQRETRFTASPMLREHGVASGMSVPILGHDAPFGVLDAHTRTARVFGRDDVHFLQSVANLVATALQRHRAEAEREELFARTLAAQDEAERAARSKSDFLAVMSHELRTPLGAISGYVELLEMGVHGPLTDTQHHDLARIRHCQQFLLSLINNVLAYMKLGSGQVSYDLTSVPMGDLAASVEELIRPQMDARHLRYERRATGGDLRVRADRGKLEQIVLNLLSNATKFTEPGGSVELECAAEARTVCIRVRDTGCGIPREQLERVFDPYVQVADAAPRRSGEGTGLGLAISRDLARGMGGDILVESRLGEGSTFTVFLPLDTEPAPRPPAAADPVPGRS